MLWGVFSNETSNLGICHQFCEEKAVGQKALSAEAHVITGHDDLVTIQ